MWKHGWILSYSRHGYVIPGYTICNLRWQHARPRPFASSAHSHHVCLIWFVFQCAIRRAYHVQKTRCSPRALLRSCILWLIIYARTLLVRDPAVFIGAFLPRRKGKWLFDFLNNMSTNAHHSDGMMPNLTLSTCTRVYMHACRNLNRENLFLESPLMLFRNLGSVVLSMTPQLIQQYNMSVWLLYSTGNVSE